VLSRLHAVTSRAQMCRFSSCLLAAVSVASADAFAVRHVPLARLRSKIFMNAGFDEDETRDAAFMNGGKGFDQDQTRDAASSTYEQDRLAAMQRRQQAEAKEFFASQGAVKPPGVSPAAAVVIGGGSLGIVGAALCTSTGSPPTGLAIAVGSILFMAIGSRLLDPTADAPAAKPAVGSVSPAAAAKPSGGSVSPAAAVVIGGGSLGIVGAAFCTSTGSPPTGLAIAVGSILFMAIGSRLLE